MDLSPNDIRNYEFPNQMRGYDKQEVDNFLEHVANALETAKQEQLRLSMELDSVRSQLSGLKQFEDTIKNAAIDARRNADTTVAAAKKEAEEMLSRARAEAAEALTSRTQQVGEIEEQITNIGLTRKSYLSKIRSLIQSHLDMINEIENGEAPMTRSEDEIEVTESTEVKAMKRETVATQPSARNPIRAEEANAPDGSMESLSEASREDLTEALKGVLGGDGEADNAAPIDPELAAALESYKRAAAEQTRARVSAPPPEPDLPRPGEMLETTARAEDIPKGFVSNESEQLNADTDKVRFSSSGGSHAGTGRINTGRQVDGDAKRIPPDALAKNLDEVVAKFEEEMDKAEKR